MSMCAVRVVEVADLTADEFVALIDRVLGGAEKTFGIEDGSVILEWRTSDQERLAQAKMLFQEYGLRHGVYYGGAFVQMIARTGRHGAARLTLI